VFVLIVRMCFNSRLLGKKILEDIDQLFEPGIAGEKSFYLDTKVRTFIAGLLVRKCVVVVLSHALFGVLWRIITSIRKEPHEWRDECL